MIKVELNAADCAVFTKEIVSKKTGEVLRFREQKAYIYNGGIYPKQFVISLDKEQAEYSAGLYTIDSSSFDVGDFGALKIKDIKLMPLREK